MMSSIFDFEKREVIEAIRAQRTHTIQLLEDLSDEQWETEAVPRWRVREVAAHLITTDEASLTLKYAGLGFKRVPIEQIEVWNDRQVPRVASKPIPALLHSLDQWGRRFARALAVPPGRVARGKFPTPFGRVSLLWLGMLRVYDEWVHMEDVRRALSLPGDDAPEAVRPAAKELLAGIPIQTLPDVPAGAEGQVTIGFTDLDLPALGIDLGARRFGTAIAGTGGRITGDAPTLIMIAAGRDSWREAETAGRLHIEGDRKPAEILLDVLCVA
jgi:uncharacterized protein (TIGR03083 family)